MKDHAQAVVAITRPDFVGQFQQAHKMRRHELTKVPQGMGIAVLHGLKLGIGHGLAGTSHAIDHHVG